MVPVRAFARLQLFAAVSAVALAPWAQARAQETLEGEPVEIVEQAASLRAPGAQTTVVDTAKFGGEVRAVSELLATAPGVAVHASGGPGQLSTVSLRGATADQSLVLLDGIPLQGPGGGAIDLSTLPASLLERLIVSRGVVGAQFGAGALGGAIELVPRTAREKASGGVQLSAGSFGTAQGALDVAAPMGNGSALVAVQLDRTQGDFDYARQLTPNLPNADYYDFTRANDDARRGSMLLRIAQRLTPAVELDALAQGSAGERGLPGPLAATTAEARASDGSALGGLRLRGVAGSVAWSVRGWGRFDSEQLRNLPGDLDERSRAGRVEAEVGAPLGTAQWVKALISAGGESASGTDTGDHRRGIFGAALADDVRLGEAFSLHPALRFDQAGGTSGVSPSVAAVHRRGPLELRASWGLSFRAPTFTELYLDQGGALPNPDLQPERAWSVDGGVAWRSERLTLSASVFWSRYRELILYELYPPFRLKPFNAGAARIAGAEAQAIVQLPYGLTAEASYSFLDAVNDREGPQNGHHLPYRPPHRLFTRLAHKGDRFEGYAEAGYTAQMPRNQYDTAFLPAQTLLNAGAGVRVAGGFWLDVEAKNLLDARTYEDLFQYPLPGFSLAVIARARL